MLKHLKHHWKRTVSGLMALVMAAGMLPVNGLAAEVPEPAAKTQAEAAYASTGNFELVLAGTTAWNGREESMTVYSSQTGTTQEAEIPAGEPFALLRARKRKHVACVRKRIGRDGQLGHVAERLQVGCHNILVVEVAAGILCGKLQLAHKIQRRR